MIRILFSTALAFFSTGATAAIIYTAEMKQLWMAINGQYTDQFMSSLSEVNVAISSFGYLYPPTLIGYVESSPLENSNIAVFRRTYGGPPWIDHFYTTRTQDYLAVLGLGWADEGNVGALRKVQEIGSIPLYRLSYYWPASGDLMHRYMTNASVRAAFINAGWADEGVEGYLWSPPVPNVPAHPSLQPSVRFEYSNESGFMYLISEGGVRSLEDSPSFTQCPGSAQVYVDGNYQGTATFSLGVLPGYFNTLKCYSTVGFGFGTHTYRAEFAGFTARIVSFITGDSWVTWPPYIAEVTETH